jgi:broad specificity polyphosphatase/5'/3'-nucleotidase SurE
VESTLLMDGVNGTRLLVALATSVGLAIAAGFATADGLPALAASWGESYAEQSSSLAYREAQPRHFAVLSQHMYRERRHSFRSVGAVARASCMAFLRAQ